METSFSRLHAINVYTYSYLWYNAGVERHRMAATQMNIRIDSTLKSAGDLAIREGGSSPSEVVREVWGYATRNRHKPQAIRRLLEFLNDAKPSCGGEAAESPVDEIEEQVLRGPRLIEEYCQRMGVSPSALEPTSYEELKGAAFDEGYLEPMPL